MMINGRSPVWHARRKKLLHMFNRWTNNFARIGTAYLHLTAGYTDKKMLIAKKKKKKKKKKHPETNVLGAGGLKCQVTSYRDVDLCPALGSEVQGKGCR